MLENGHLVIAYGALRKPVVGLCYGFQGTSGLFGPEYLATGNFNWKQDVFNIGVFLLVLLSGQTVYNISRPEEEIFLLDHVKKCMADDRLNKAIDSTIIAEGAWPG
ncbi:hypothetical protein OIU76_016288 [Salix suchowensis]|nr:hypothetical protein OIU76_016288 [Salix suchowensis]